MLHNTRYCSITLHKEYEHWKKFGYMNRYNVWMSHDSTEKSNVPMFHQRSSDKMQQHPTPHYIWKNNRRKLKVDCLQKCRAKTMKDAYQYSVMDWKDMCITSLCCKSDVENQVLFPVREIESINQRKLFEIDESKGFRLLSRQHQTFFSLHNWQKLISLSCDILLQTP